MKENKHMKIDTDVPVHQENNTRIGYKRWSPSTALSLVLESKRWQQKLGIVEHASKVWSTLAF